MATGLSLVLILGLVVVYRRMRERGRLKLVGDVVTSLGGLLHRATARSPFRSTRTDVVASVRRLLGRPDEVRDSKAFEKALEIWSDAILHDNSTPRTFKRFLNRLRYFAAMLHVEYVESVGWKREANLVALAALHHLDFDIQRMAMRDQADMFQHEGAISGLTQESDAEEDEAVRARRRRICDACRKHDDPCSWKTVQEGEVESPWPPKESEIEQFRSLSDGIHV